MSDTNLPQINYALNEQQTEATIEIEGTRFHVTTEQLEHAIALLGALRSHMNPPVSSDPDTNRIHPADLFSTGRLGVSTEKGAVIRFRSIQFGWFELYLSHEWCSGLIAYLQGGTPVPPKDASTKH